jgi:hypothetical protein
MYPLDQTTVNCVRVGGGNAGNKSLENYITKDESCKPEQYRTNHTLEKCDGDNLRIKRLGRVESNEENDKKRHNTEYPRCPFYPENHSEYNPVMPFLQPLQQS